MAKQQTSFLRCNHCRKVYRSNAGAIRHLRDVHNRNIYLNVTRVPATQD